MEYNTRKHVSGPERNTYFCIQRQISTRTGGQKDVRGQVPRYKARTEWRRCPPLSVDFLWKPRENSARTKTIVN